MVADLDYIRYSFSVIVVIVVRLKTPDWDSSLQPPALWRTPVGSCCSGRETLLLCVSGAGTGCVSRLRSEGRKQGLRWG